MRRRLGAILAAGVCVLAPAGLRERFELDRMTRSKFDAVLSAEQRRTLPDTAVGDMVFREWPVWGL